MAYGYYWECTSRLNSTNCVTASLGSSMVYAHFIGNDRYNRDTIGRT